MKRWVWILVLIVLIVVVVLVARARRAEAPETRFDPVAAAKARYEEVRGEGGDLERGPCLGLIGPDWVADIAHDPRQPVDDDPANQCEEYRTGKASHFVELTPEGTIIQYR